jgi:hypothetical protein
MAKKFEPVVVYDAVGYMRQFWLAVERVEDTVWYIRSDTTRPDLFVCGALIGQIGNVGDKTRLIKSERDPNELAARFKRHAMKFGATPEAIRLLGQMLPIDKEEESKMAKLARKDELKAAAAETPVAGKRIKAVPAAKVNNGERLVEAAASRRAELLNDKRKIVATEKGKAKLAKVEDDDKLALMISARTVGAALEEEGVAYRDITYAEKVGLVELV